MASASTAFNASRQPLTICCTFILLKWFLVVILDFMTAFNASANLPEVATTLPFDRLSFADLRHSSISSPDLLLHLLLRLLPDPLLDGN